MFLTKLTARWPTGALPLLHLHNHVFHPTFHSPRWQKHNAGIEEEQAKWAGGEMVQRAKGCCFWSHPPADVAAVFDHHSRSFSLGDDCQLLLWILSCGRVTWRQQPFVHCMPFSGLLFLSSSDTVGCPLGTASLPPGREGGSLLYLRQGKPGASRWRQPFDHCGPLFASIVNTTEQISCFPTLFTRLQQFKTMSKLQRYHWCKLLVCFIARQGVLLPAFF